MIWSDIIIVGAGPAGSACAWKLKKMGLNVLILERKKFPRSKVCAGWITPDIFDILGVHPEKYPYALTRFNRIYFYLFGIKIPVRTRQYAVRRHEFDQWMLSRSSVTVRIHAVKNVVKSTDGYVIDDAYRCRFIVGAGGTFCPVFKHLFSSISKRDKPAQIVGIEKEYRFDYPAGQCHLWFFDKGLPGYSWYLPKKNRWLNIGIGGKTLKLKAQGKSILDYWHEFTDKLQKLSLINNIPVDPKGHTYYIHRKRQFVRTGNAFIIGDAAGLSTLDMGEGIYAAISSGLMAGDAIAGKKRFNPAALSKFSLPRILLAKTHSRLRHFK